MKFKLFKSQEKTTRPAVADTQLQSIIANLEDGVVVYDSDFKVTLFNKAAESIFGVKADEVLGKVIGPESVKNSKMKLLTQVVFPSLAPLVLRQTEANVYPQITYLSFTEPRLELRVSGDRIVDATGRATSFVKVVHDRTREVDLSRSKSEFITIAAHQLRTPLTAVNWTLENLDRSASMSEDDKLMVKNGLLAAAKVLKIVNDLLDVAKIEEGRFGYNLQNLDIAAFIEEILKNATPIGKQYGVNLYFDRGGESPINLQFDPDKLGMALSNLIDNAIRYNVKNGSVTVSLKRLSDKPYVQVGVQDTGIGIPAGDMPKLFGKFFRAENALKLESEGSGLGLYISKNIITRHGGTISAESTLGRGSTFYFTLPTDPKLIPPKEVFTGE